MYSLCKQPEVIDDAKTAKMLFDLLSCQYMFGVTLTRMDLFSVQTFVMHIEEISSGFLTDYFLYIFDI
jgi:hypothetical protein